jgi:cyclophilin family peptidyl-prolyl cis-trans isomerase
MRLPTLLLAMTLAATTLSGESPKPRVRLATSCGPIILELEPEAAPATVENFLAYVKEGFFTGTIFHRVIRGFMIQGGGFTEDLKEKPTRFPVINEADRSSQKGLLNRIGTIAMARTEEPDSASSQFFINTADNTALNHRNRSKEGFGYCVFGRVVEGLDVVAKIENVITLTRRGMPNVPEYAVRIQSAEVLPEPTTAPVN